MAFRVIVCVNSRLPPPMWVSYHSPRPITVASFFEELARPGSITVSFHVLLPNGKR